jgi:hypothetical protein
MSEPILKNVAGTKLRQVVINIRGLDFKEGFDLAQCLSGAICNLTTMSKALSRSFGSDTLRPLLSDRDPKKGA